MEITGDPPPLWPQLTNPMPRRRSPSLLFTPPVLIILLPTVALLILFFAVPPFVSITTQIFRPNGIRKSWDSLNIFLVLCAILCGVFARRNDDDDDNNTTTTNDNNIRNDSNNNKRSHPVSQQWFEYPERKIYDDPPINATSSATSVRRLKRSSSSYPDLRQDSLWENTEDRFRFFDDFEINKYRSSTNYSDQVHELRRSWRSEFEESEAKVIPVDTFVLPSSPSSPPSKSPAPSTPPPPPPPPPAARHKSRRTYQAVGQKEKVKTQNDHVEFNKIKSPQPVTPPPPQPPPPPPRRPPSPLVQMGNRSDQKYAKMERRKSNATKEIKMVFASLRKRKKKQKSKDHDHDHQQVCPLHSPRESPPYYFTTIPPPSPPPPPPPLPPSPSSVFQKYNLFRKGSKTRKIHSVPASPPPIPAAFSLSKRSSKQNGQIPPTPPPAPPPAFFSTKRLSKQKSQIPPPSKPPPAPPTPPPEPSRRRTTANRGRPPLPTKANTSYYDENMNSGGHSPLIPMPPPPPPFKMSEFKFMVREDFVKIQSNPSSRCSFPDLEEIDVSSSKDDVETVILMDGDDGVGVGGVPVFCPSPDVNAKAETFIARLKDGWKLEKMNSMKEKQRI